MSIIGIGRNPLHKEQRESQRIAKLNATPNGAGLGAHDVEKSKEVASVSSAGVIEKYGQFDYTPFSEFRFSK